MLDSATERIPNNPIGNAMCLPKESTITRIHFQNVNGLTTLPGGTWELACDHWKTMEVDIALACEHKLDTTQPYVISQLHKGAKKILGLNNFSLVATSTKVRSARPWKPGGVLAMTLGTIQGRIMEKGQDELGRWAFIKLRRDNSPPIMVISTYQVVDVPAQEAGKSTYATQLYAAYSKEKRPDPEKLRKHHSDDLVAFVQNCQSRGELIILAGDLNETLGEDTAGMTRLCSQCRLRDPIWERHSVTDFATYKRGQRVLDYILVDPDLLPSVQQCGYEPFEAHIPSDHRGIFIDLITTSTFGKPVPLAPMKAREIISTKPHQIKPYFDHKDKHLKDHKWYERIAELRDKFDKGLHDDSLAEQLYTRLITASNYAASRLKTFPPAPYSPEIVRLRNIKHLLRLLLSSLTSAYDTSHAIEDAKAKLGHIDFVLPTNEQECRKALAAATKEFKLTVTEEEKTRKLRKSHLSNKITEYEGADKQKEAKRIKRIQRAEEVKRVFQKCEAIRHPNKQGGLAYILVPENPDDDPKRCKNWKQLICPKEMEPLLLDRNLQHFGQSKNCTLTSTPLNFTMAFTGGCICAEAILNGDIHCDCDPSEPANNLESQSSTESVTQTNKNSENTTATTNQSFSFSDSDNESDSDRDSVFYDSDGFSLPRAWRRSWNNITTSAQHTWNKISTAFSLIQPNKPPAKNTAVRHNTNSPQTHTKTKYPTVEPCHPTHPKCINIQKLHPLTGTLLEALQYVTKPDSITCALSLEEYNGKLRVWDERTSTSPCSNMHLGHLKAYRAEHLFPQGSEKQRDLDDIRDTILDGHLLLLNYALKFKYSYNCWKTVVTTMLEKDPGEPKIHRLRVIHLYEADYNLILGVKWRSLLHHACDNGLLNTNQFGSQPGKEALDAVFIRELEYEMSRLTRKSTIHFDNDATSCYDRIPCFLASVVSRKYGMHRNVCVVMGRTLAEAKYHLKTKLGISDAFIQHSEAHPIFGTGQGSGNSPMIWLFISSTLFDIYETKVENDPVACPDGQLSTTINIIGFVDDVRNSTIAFLKNVTSLPTLSRKATRNAQNWHDILATSNQSLELSKCGYHAIVWGFEDKGDPFLITKPTTTITLKDVHGKPLTIKQWANTEAAKYLGTYKCPADQKKQYEILEAKCNEFAKIINCSHLSRKETQCFYWAIYRLSANYALPTAYFSKKELKKLQSKSHTAMVTKSGYNRHTPLEVVYGPHFLGGAGFFHLYDDQGYGQIRLFMKFWRSPSSKPGKLLRIVFAWAQRCAGIGTSILEDVSTELPHLEAKWFASLRKFLKAVNGTIQICDPPIPPLQRQNDEFLMDVAIRSKKFKGAALRRINYCRMHLNVLFVSDVVTPCGICLDPQMYKGTEERDKTTMYSVNQPRPNVKAWKIWQRFLHLLCKNPRSQDHTLALPLGPWKVPVSKLHRQWSLLYDEDTDFLYQRSILGTSRHKRLRFGDFDREAVALDIPIPETAVPVQVKERPYTWSVMDWSPSNYSYISTPLASFYDTTDSMDPWEYSLFMGLEFGAYEDHVWKHLCTTTCLIATDGSAPTPKGSFAWVLYTEDGTQLVTCNGPAFGEKISSYRAEGYGILSALRFLVNMAKVHQKVNGPTILPPKMLCDNQGIVKTYNNLQNYKHAYPNASMASEWDVIAEIRTATLALGQSTPTLTHIKGHQDATRPFHELPLSARMNCEADWLANSYLSEDPIIDFSTVPILPTSGCQLNLEKGTVTFNLKQQLRMATSIPPLRAKLCKKHDWSHDTFDNIDWTAHGRALRRHDRHRVTMVKFLNDILPLGKLANTYDPKYPPSCPSCSEPLEDRQHFWTCQAPTRRKWRTDCYRALFDHLEDSRTALPLQTLLLDAFDAVLHNKDFATIRADPSVQHVATAQAAIGWDQIIKGRFAAQWSACQHAHFGPDCNKRLNGTSWLTNVIDLIYKEWWKLWEMRNGDRHGRDLATRLQAEAAQAARELTLLYDTHSLSVVERLRWLFAIPLHTRLQWRTTDIIQWINTWKPVIEESYQTRLETG
jgi:hypothetical protein